MKDSFYRQSSRCKGCSLIPSRIVDGGWGSQINAGKRLYRKRLEEAGVDPYENICSIRRPEQRKLSKGHAGRSGQRVFRRYWFCAITSITSFPPVQTSCRWTYTGYPSLRLNCRGDWRQGKVRWPEDLRSL